MRVDVEDGRGVVGLGACRVGVPDLVEEGCGACDRGSGKANSSAVLERDGRSCPGAEEQGPAHPPAFFWDSDVPPTERVRVGRRNSSLAPSHEKIAGLAPT